MGIQVANEEYRKGNEPGGLTARQIGVCEQRPLARLTFPGELARRSAGMPRSASRQFRGAFDTDQDFSMLCCPMCKRDKKSIRLVG